MLKNANSRSEYDQQLAAQVQAADDVAIAEEVHISDMKETISKNGHEHEVSCRCGGSYSVSNFDLHSAVGSIILPCSNCSLHILLRRN